MTQAGGGVPAQPAVALEQGQRRGSAAEGAQDAVLGDDQVAHLGADVMHRAPVARDFATLRSVLSTARQQGRHAIEALLTPPDELFASLTF